MFLLEVQDGEKSDAFILETRDTKKYIEILVRAAIVCNGVLPGNTGKELMMREFLRSARRFDRILDRRSRWCVEYSFMRRGRRVCVSLTFDEKLFPVLLSVPLDTRGHRTYIY